MQVGRKEWCLPEGKNDCVGVKFEVRKHFTRVGAISTGEC